MRKILHFKKGLCPNFSKTRQIIFQEPKELGGPHKERKFNSKFLPKHTDIDKILKVIQRKVLNGTHFPVEIKEIQAGYLHSSYFKDIYINLSQNKLTSSKAAIRQKEVLAEIYILLDLLLFKITPERETALLGVPETCIDKVITLYHSSLF